ncbi:MAG TPA: DNA repair protein RecO [bacterium]|nr:DNA repair protein RecO [bacterium]
MAPIKIEAIVLKKIDFRETSVILTLYTEQLGKVKCILKGVRTEKGRVPPLAFTPGSCIFAFYYLRRSELGLLSSPSLVDSYQMAGVESLAVWQIILNLVNLFTPEREREDKIFNLLRDTGSMLSSTSTPAILFVSFKIKLIKILGYGIELKRCIICGSVKNLYLFSGKLGGVVCKDCSSKDTASVRISYRVLAVARQLERIDFRRVGVIKQIPGDILAKINFYSNITLNYHAGLNKIWWQDEKNILFKNN